MLQALPEEAPLYKGRPCVSSEAPSSFVRKVHYKKLIDDLWKMEISYQKDEDSIINNTIANTTFGKLEKGIK